MEHLQILIICRIISMWVLCRTGRSIRGKAPIALAAILYFWWVYGMLATDLRRATLLIFQFCLDLLLFLGHRWDVRTPAITVLNVRMFYVAVVSTTMVSLMLASEP
jgi:hypothetical protein